MAFCDNCGHVLKPTAKFCGSCGTPITEEETTSQDTNSTYTDSRVYDSGSLPKQKRSMGKAKKLGIGLVILIVVFVVFGAVASSVSSGPTFTTPQLSEQEIKDSSIGFVQYNELLRNNDPYVGKIIEFSGEVRFLYGDNFLLREPNGDQYIRVNYDDDECLIIRGDGIRVWGTVVGLDTYSTMMGKKTVPEVNALFMSRC